MKVFPIKETFFQRYVYSKLIPAKRQETWEIIRRHDGTNHFYLCPGKVRVQFHNYNEFVKVIFKSVWSFLVMIKIVVSNANGTFFNICIIMIYGVNY